MTEPLRDIEDITASYASRVERMRVVLTGLVKVHRRIAIFASIVEGITGDGDMVKDAMRIADAITDAAEITDGMSADTKELLNIYTQDLMNLDKEVLEVRRQLIAIKEHDS